MPSIDPLDAAASRYLLDDTVKRCPYDELARIRSEATVVPTSAGPWLLVGYSAVDAMLRDPRFSRSSAARDTIAGFLDPGPAAELWLSKIVSSDGPDHRRLRSLVSRSFTPRAIDHWWPLIASTTDRLIEAVRDRGRMEVVRDLAYPLPEHLICSLLGVPIDDHSRFEAWTHTINERTVAGANNAELRTRAGQAIHEFEAYLRELIAARRGDLRDDLLSQLITAEEEGSKLSDFELVALLIELINGGHDTTANLITNGCLVLTQRPDLQAQLHAEPDLIPAFVEEMMRLRSPVQMSLTRVTTEDVELGGKVIPAGSVAVASLAAANRDGTVFDDSDAFDLRRAPHGHVGFGAGPHFCLGANLARAEARAAFAAVTRCLPQLRLDTAESDLPWRRGSLVIAPAELPVRWDPRTGGKDGAP